MRRRNNIRITRIIAATGEVANQLQSLHFANFRPVAKRWQPAVNAYCQPDGIDLCVDLAGVQKERIEIVAEPQRIILGGERYVPNPAPHNGAPLPGCNQLFFMEIENGTFERVINLPNPIAPEKTTARKDDGYLWIHLLYQLNES
jgi:HSP20 family molecular chaperone IbpA